MKKYILSRHYKFPPHLSPELQHTIQKCLSLDRYDRLSLKIFLSSDPWFNNHGTLEDIFEQRVPNISYNAHDATESYAESAKSEDNNRIQFSVQNSKRQCKQDLQEEMRRGRKVPKTVIYHSFNPATYFTGPAPHSSSNPINLEAQTRVMAELYENLLVTLKQVRLQQIHNVSLTDLKSPISHLFRKLKHTNSNGLLVDEQQQPKLRKAASAFSLSQLYQRVTKDHISYFSIQCDIRSGSSTTVISGYSTSSTFVSENRPVPVHSKRLSHRLSMVFFSNTLPDLNNPPPSTELKQVECNQSEMIKIVRLACQILGITFYQTSNTQLVCLLTLRNCKKSSVITQSPTPTTTQPSLYRSKLFTSSDRLSERRNQQQQSNSMISNSSSSSINNGWWSRKVHRLSAPFNNASANSQSIVNPGSSAAGLVLGTSSHDLLSVARLTQQEQHQENTVTEEEDAASIDHDPDGFAMLSIDVSSVSCSKQNQDGTPLQIVALRYSKIKGSNKVFKLAKGWIQMALSSRDNQSDPSEQPPQFGGFDRHKADRYETETYMKSVHAKRTFDNNNDDTMIRL